MFNKVKRIKPEVAFLFIGLIFGMAFLFATPPFQVSDEQSHFYKSLYLSDGHVIPEKVGNNVGVYVPANTIGIYEAVRDLPFHVENKHTISEITTLLNIPLDKHYKVFTSTLSEISVITYSPLPYVASAFAIVIGELFNLPPLLLLYIGRLANLVLWLLLIYIAIKVTPVHKWVFLLLALMPMTIFQAASLSADSFTIGLSFLVIAVFLKLALDTEKIEKRDIGVLFLLVLGLALSKQIYFIILLLFFLIPSSKFGGNKRKLLTFVTVSLPILMVSAIWNFIAKNWYVPSISQVSVQGQISFIILHPFNFMYLLLSTLAGNLTSYLMMFVGTLGWLNNPVYLPTWLICAYLFILILVSLLDKKDKIIQLNQKIISLITFSLISLLMLAVEYITYTPVGQNVIIGVQGRYFIPIAPMLLLLLYNKKIDYDIEKGLSVVIIIFIIISLIITLFEIIKRFYIL